MTRVQLTLRLRQLADVLVEVGPSAQAVAGALGALDVRTALQAFEAEAAVLREAADMLELDLLDAALRDRMVAEAVARLEATTSELRARFSREVPTT